MPALLGPIALQAMTMPVVGHLDPAFFQVMDDVCDMLREVFHTANFMTLPISSTGTGAMETACANIIERGDTVVVCRNGFFGDRLAEIADRCGAQTHVVDTPWGKPVDVDDIGRIMKVSVEGGEPIEQTDTSTGVTTSYLDAFQAPHRVLLGAGPSSVHPRVLQAPLRRVTSIIQQAGLEPAEFEQLL